MTDFRKPKVPKATAYLTAAEYDKLKALGMRDRRTVGKQAAYIIRRRLAKETLLELQPSPTLTEYDTQK